MGADGAAAAAAAARILKTILGGRECRVADETDLFDLENWDSLKHMQLVLEIETYLTAELDTSEIESLITIGDLHRLLSEKRVS